MSSIGKLLIDWTSLVNLRGLQAIGDLSLCLVDLSAADCVGRG